MNIFLLVILSFFIGIFQYISYVKNDDVAKTRQDQVLTPEQNRLKLKLNCLKQQHANILNNYLVSAAYNGAGTDTDGIVNLTNSDETCGEELGTGNDIESKMVCVANGITTNCATVLCEDMSGANAGFGDKADCLENRRDNSDDYKVYFVSTSTTGVTNNDYSLLLDSGVGYYDTAGTDSSFYSPSGKIDVDGLSDQIQSNAPAMVYDIAAFKIASAKERCWNDVGEITTWCSEGSNDHPACNPGAILENFVCRKERDDIGTFKVCENQEDLESGVILATDSARSSEFSSHCGTSSTKYFKSFDLAEDCWICNEQKEVETVDRCKGDEIRFSIHNYGSEIENDIDIVDGTECGQMGDARNECTNNPNPRAKFPTWMAVEPSILPHEKGYYYCSEKNPEEFGCSPCEQINSTWDGCENFYAETTDTSEWEDITGTSVLKKVGDLDNYRSRAGTSGSDDRGCAEAQCASEEEPHMVWDGTSKVFKKFCCNVGEDFVCDGDDASNCSCEKRCVTSGGEELLPGETSSNGFEICPSSEDVRACLVSEVSGSGHVALTPGSDECPGGFFSKVYNPVLKCYYCLIPSPLPMSNNENKNNFFEDVFEFVKNIDFSIISSANAAEGNEAVNISVQPICMNDMNLGTNGICSNPNTYGGRIRFDFLSSDFSGDTNSISYQHRDVRDTITNNCKGTSGCKNSGENITKDDIDFVSNKNYNNVTGFFSQPSFKSATTNLSNACYLYCQDSSTCGLGTTSTDLRKGYVRIFKSFESSCSGEFSNYESGWSGAVPNWCPGTNPNSGGIVAKDNLRISGFSSDSDLNYLVNMEWSTSNNNKSLRWDGNGIWSTGDSYGGSSYDYISDSVELSYSETNNGNYCREFQIARPEEMAYPNGAGTVSSRLNKSGYGVNIYDSAYHSNLGVNDNYREYGFRNIGESKISYEFLEKPNYGYVWELIDNTTLSDCPSSSLTEMDLKYGEANFTPVTGSGIKSTTFLVEKVRYRDLDGNSSTDWEWQPYKNCHFEVPKLYCSDNEFWASAPNFLGHGHAAGTSGSDEAKKVLIVEALKMYGGKTISDVDTSNLCPNGMKASVNSTSNCVTCEINFNSNVRMTRSFVSSPDMGSCESGSQSINFGMCDKSSRTLDSKGIIDVSLNADNVSNRLSRRASPDECPRACKEGEAIVYTTAGEYRCSTPNGASNPTCISGYEKKVVKITKGSGSSEYHVPSYLCVESSKTGNSSDNLDSINFAGEGYCPSSFGVSYNLSTSSFVGEIDTAKQKSSGYGGSKSGCDKVYIDINGNTVKSPDGNTSSLDDLYIEYYPTPVRSAYGNCLICI